MTFIQYAEGVHYYDEKNNEYLDDQEEFILYVDEKGNRTEITSISHIPAHIPEVVKKATIQQVKIIMHANLMQEI